jgi:hypothetical protein
MPASRLVGRAPTAGHRSAILDVVEVMSADIDAIAAELTEAIHANLDELEPDLRQGTHLSCRSNVDMILTMLTEGARPSQAVPRHEALIYAREYVHRHHGLELLQRAYRTGQARLSEMWLEQLSARAGDVDELAQTFGFFNGWLFGWVETLESGLTEYYMAERDRHLHRVGAMRAEEVQAILEGAPIDPAATSLRLRYELDRNHLAFVIWAEGSELDQRGQVLFAAMEQEAAETAAALGALDHLTVPLRGHLACWAGFRSRVPSVDVLDPALTPERRQLDIAFGELGQGIAGFRRSYEEAVMARHVHQLRHPGGSQTIRFRDVALDALLLQNPEEAARFVRRQLGTLAEDSDSAARLRATLGVFLQENASYLHTARRLGVHENTVAYRIRRAQELLERDLKGSEMELQTALRLSRLALR